MSNLDKMIQGIDTLKTMGLKILEATPNVLKIAMPCEGNRNHWRRVCGGDLFVGGISVRYDVHQPLRLA